jgi:hypothetical protein
MALFPLGILSAAGAVVGGQTYELISTTVLGGTAASVTFSNLGDYASTYKHLQVRYAIRTDRSGFSSDTVITRFNGDTGSNYAWHRIWGDGSSVQSDAGTTQTFMRSSITSAALSTANAFSAGFTDVLDPYSTTKNKTIRSLNGNIDQSFIFLWSGLWINTSSLTSITLSSQNAANLVAGSRFSLYGIRG